MDEVGDIDLFGGALDRLAGDVRRAEFDVVGDRAAEQEWVLQDHAAAAAQRLQVHLAHIHAVDSNRTLLHIVEAQQQRDQGGLAGARMADDGYGLARAQW